MKNVKLTIMLAVSVMVLLTGCWLQPYQPPQGMESNEAIYVMNGSAATISIIDIEEDTVYNDVAQTGMYPNQLYLYDGKLYSVNSGSNSLSIFNISDFTEEAPIALGIGKNPMEMIVVDDDVAYISCYISNQVLKVDLLGKSVIDSMDAGQSATALAESDNKLYVTNAGVNPDYSYTQGTVSVFNLSDGSLEATINVATNPQDVAVDAQGKIHVLCTGNYWDEFAQVKIIDPVSDTVIDSISLGAGNMAGVLYINQVNNIAYCGSWGTGAVTYSTDTYDILEAPFTVKGANGIAVDIDANIWISNWGNNTVYKLNNNATVIDSFTVGVGPQNLVYYNNR